MIAVNQNAKGFLKIGTGLSQRSSTEIIIYKYIIS